MKTIAHPKIFEDTLSLNILDSEYDWQTTEPYCKEEFFEHIDTLVQRYFYGFRHPLGQKLLEGQLNSQALKFLATQEYHYYSGTTWWNACKLAQSDTLAQQRLLHAPLLDELGTNLVTPQGELAHIELFMNYCKSLGLEEKDVNESPIVPSVVLAVTELRRIIRERPTFESLACSNLVVERMRPAHYKKLLEVFKSKYTWVPQSGLRFYEVHATLDEDHESLGRKIIGQYIYCKQNQDSIFSSVLRSLCLRLVMYDGIFNAISSSETFAIVPWPNFPKEPWPRPQGTSNL